MSSDPERGVEVDVGHPEVDERLVDDRVERHHLAAQVPQQPGHDRADLAGADHRCRLARHVEADQPLEREVAVAHTVVGSMDLAVQRQHEGQRVLGHGVRRVRRHPDHRDPESLRRREVDVVEPCAPQRHAGRSGRRQDLQHLGGQIVVDEGADHSGVRCVPRRPLVEPRLVIVDLDRRLVRILLVGRIEGPAVVGLGREHRHRRHGPDPYLARAGWQSPMRGRALFTHAKRRWNNARVPSGR
jgi:hypothetical protein